MCSTCFLIQEDGDCTLPLLVAAAVLLVISLLPALPGHTKYFEHDNSDNRIAYEYARNILAGLDENAILFTNGDNDTFPIWYLQEVEKFRNDITVVNLSLVNLPWYVKQLKQNPDKPLAMQRSDAEIDALIVENFGDYTITNLQVTDSLADTYAGATDFSVDGLASLWVAPMWLRELRPFVRRQFRVIID